MRRNELIPLNERRKWCRLHSMEERESAFGNGRVIVVDAGARNAWLIKIFRPITPDQIRNTICEEKR
jgi:hypothetical protein